MKQFKSFKEYQKDIFTRLTAFTRTFKPWEKWQDVNLTELNPCKNCAISKELIDNSHYFQLSGGAAEELTESCKHCEDRMLWTIECCQKLQWYETYDERLKEEPK